MFHVQHHAIVFLAGLLLLSACGKEDEPSESKNDMMATMPDSGVVDMSRDMSPRSDLGADMGAQPLDPNGDEDGDGLTNKQEVDGWMISVDRVGLGNALTELVTSDPLRADSDDDGLNDQAEFQRTDPNKPDTDGDGLTDAEEVNVYLSIATSVDTDGDSISGATSNAQLWDGDEINKWGTSPSLKDTDGDGRSDFDEIINNATNPLVAQVPLVDVSFVGNIDISLDVVYEESEINDQTYGRSYGTAQSSSRGKTNGTAVTHSVSNTTTIGAEVSSGWPPSAKVSVSRSKTTGYSNESSTSLTAEEGRSAQQEYSRAQRFAREYTETSSAGKLSMGMVISNPSSLAYTLTNLTVSVLQWDSLTQEFKTVGTMTPPGLDSLNFAPGMSTPAPIQVSAENLNVSLIRDFLRDPKSLVFTVSNFDLENSEGLNFVFLDEVTQSRTGRVIVDFGDGRVDDHRVATNVRRNEDGSLAGVTLQTVFEDYLKIPFETQPWASDNATGPLADKRGVQVLTKVRDLENQPMGEDLGFWIVFSDIADLDTSYKDFGETVLQRGETLYVAYMRDGDGDGVYDREEEFHGSSDEMVDSDGDMLTDFEEVKEGWIAGTGLSSQGYPRQVFSTPTADDPDEDGLNDLAERMAGTDPHNADTDGDLILDGVDPKPLDASNDAPTITLVQTFDDPVVTLTGSIIDLSDAIDEVVIDWGDSTTTPLVTGLDAVDISHGYLVPGSYTITVTATDARQASDSQTFMVTTTTPYAYASYSMNEGMLLDAAGTRHGTVYSAPGFAQLIQDDRLDVARSAIRFSDDFDTSSWAYGIINNLGNIDLDDFSLAFWVKGGDSGKAIMHQPGRLLVTSAPGDHICVYLGGRNGAAPVCTTQASNSDWMFFVVTHDATQLTIYKNGVQDASAAVQTPGNVSSCSEFHFNGELGCGRTGPNSSDDRDTFSSNLVLDDVRFFERILTPADTQTLYGERGYMP